VHAQHHKQAHNDFEALVIGGGPAGLSAALYLARYNRRVALFDAGHGRSTWHQVNRNYLGFPGGVPARELRRLGREQLSEYEHVRCIDHAITRVTRKTDAAGSVWFVASGQAGSWRGQTLIIATGVVDHYPHFDGWEEYVGRSMFWCITCDGYACKGERVVVSGNSDAAASETLQLTRFTNHLTLLTNSFDCRISAELQRRLAHAGIEIVRDKIETVDGQNGHFHALRTQTGRVLELDQLFAVQGATPQTAPFRDLGLTLDAAGYICVDEEQYTNVPGVYAAGDVTRNYQQQISTAVHEGGQAASGANYYLYPQELKDA
jgi:thioredoxin reductase (NADPH)